MPKVSVMTCTFNRAHLIGETIQSVLDQTVQDFEYIIVDDGSTDNTRDVVKSFDDGRIKYFYLPHSGGHLSALRNYGHRQCSGTFIAYVDSDDLWERTKLEVQLRGLEANPDSGFSFTDIILFNQDGILREKIYDKTGMSSTNVFPAMLANQLIICHTTLVLRSSCIGQIGAMDETMHSGDHDYAMFLSRLFPAFVVYDPLVRVRKHDQNSTGSNALSIRLMREHHRTLKKLLEKKLIDRRKHRNAYAITCYAFGIQLLAINEPVVARHYFFQTLVHRPWSVKVILRIFQTYLSQ